MSDNMERDKNETLVVKGAEEEEEEMKKELLAVGMYEPWYTYKEMKDILHIISESKYMADMANDNNKLAQKTPPHSNKNNTGAIPKTYSSQELETQEHNDVHRPIHLFRSSVFENRTVTQRRKSSDNDEKTDRAQENSTRESSHGTNKYVSLRVKNCWHDTNNLTEAKMDNQSAEQGQKLESWRINPLDFCTDESDVPLQQPNRRLARDREPNGSCEDKRVLETTQKALLALQAQLKETSALWHSSQRSTNTKFQWGSPIQVATAKSSLDRPLTTINTEQSAMECTGKNSNERPTKRKSALLLSSPSAARQFSSDDSDSELFSIKKQKTQLDVGSERELRSRKETPIREATSSQTKADDFYNDVDSNDGEAKNVKKEEGDVPDFLPRYPRRIVPPNPARTANSKKKKQRANAPRKTGRTQNGEEKESSSKEKNNALDEDGILKQLEDDSDEGGSKSVEIKPLPMKSFASRLERQTMVLKRAQLEKKKKLEAEQEEEKRKEEEKRRRKEEFHKKQMQELQEKQRKREEEGRIRDEKSTKWNQLTNAKSKEKSRAPCQQTETRLLDLEEEERLLQDTDEEDTTIREVQTTAGHRGNNVNCPICNASYPSDKIEAHAAACEQYDTDNNEDSNNANSFSNRATKEKIENADILECGICSQYRTINGIDYEEHVSNCLQKQQDRQSREHECVDIDNIPTSPIRSYRPISEQTDSQIDYMKQFGSSNRMSSNRKRKR